MFELRDYQKADRERLRQAFAEGAKRVLYQSPTASGRTIIFTNIIAGAVERGNRTIRGFAVGWQFGRSAAAGRAGAKL